MQYFDFPYQWKTAAALAYILLTVVAAGGDYAAPVRPCTVDTTVPSTSAISSQLRLNLWQSFSHKYSLCEKKKFIISLYSLVSINI